MQCDNRVLKKLIILGFCTTFIVIIVHIDDNNGEYSMKKVTYFCPRSKQFRLRLNRDGLCYSCGLINKLSFKLS